MLKKESNIKIDYLSIVFDTIKADELIRRLLGLPLDYFMVLKVRVKHKDYTNLYQFGTIKVYGDRKLKDGTSEAGCYLILSGQGCDDYYSLLQEGNNTYNNFFDYCNQIVCKGHFHLTRIDMTIELKQSLSIFKKISTFGFPIIGVIFIAVSLVLLVQFLLIEGIDSNTFIFQPLLFLLGFLFCQFVNLENFEVKINNCN